jgi:ribosomal protein S18 acetylase RimI-like enzyme
MGILQAFRGRGLGRRLAEAVIREAQNVGIERIELGVYASNEAAVALYKSLGFCNGAH